MQSQQQHQPLLLTSSTVYLQEKIQLQAAVRAVAIGVQWQTLIHELLDGLGAGEKVGLPRCARAHRTGAEARVRSTVAGAGLANMVSPLQARELGFAIASEWQAPRCWQAPALDVLAVSPGVPDSFGGIDGMVPTEFPRLSSPSQPATLCFSHPKTGRWHQLKRHWWPQVDPPATLSKLCEEALEKGELPLLRSEVDLKR